MDVFLKIDRVIRAALPVASCLSCMLLAQAPWPSDLMHALFDALTLVLLCYWVIYRPEFFPSYWSLGLGLLHDALAGQFLGLTVLAYLLADFLLRGQRTFFLNQPFLNGWLVMALVLAAANLMQWGVACLMAGVWFDFHPMLFRFALGVLVFPPVAGILYRRESEWGR